MKSQIRVIQFSILLFPFLLNSCNEINNCQDKCKNKTRDCALGNAIFSRSITNSLTSSSTASTTTTSTITKSEAEPNDTFQDSYKSSDNELSGGVGISWVINATISSSTDIDIFDIDSGNNLTGTRNVTQKNSLDKVTCNIYQRTGTSVRGFNPKLQTPTSTPDNTFSYQGKLNPSYSFSYANLGSAVVYLICSGTGGTAYTLQLDSVQTSSSSSTSFTTFTDYSSVSSCQNATKACKKKCSKSF